MKFDTLGLSDNLLRALADSGYDKPTPIQAKAIPAILSGVDVMGAAQTGTGKTAGFTLPLLQLLEKQAPQRGPQPRVLVVTPTRELAAQVHDSITTYGKYLPLRAAVVFGGVGINPQITKLRKGIDFLVATPGRLLDLYSQRAVDFDALEHLVLDEADRMLDMGFIHDIKKIMALLPRQRQNLLFSATFSGPIRQLAKSVTNKPVEIDVAPRNATVDAIEQLAYRVEKSDKVALLSHLIRRDNLFQVLVFSRTKHGADKLVRLLKRDAIDAAAIHGNKSQAQRTKALGGFKANKIQVLVATDIAARGIDIDQLSHVFNFDLPQVAEDYVHRIGRTGRAGSLGTAISFVTSDDKKMLRDIERLTKRQFNFVELTDFDLKAARPDPRRDDTKPKQRPPQSERPNRRPTKNRSAKNGASTGNSRSNSNQSRRKPHTSGNRASASR